MRNRPMHDTDSPTVRQDGLTGDQKAAERAKAAEPVYAPKRKPRPTDPKQRELGLGGGSAERSAAAPAPQSEAERPPEPLYLSSGKCCAQNNAEEVAPPRTRSVNVIAACKCASWYCEGCMEAKGWRLRRRLLGALQRFEWGVFGITLTIDGSLFEAPYDAWKYVMRRRLLPRLVEKLHKRGHLASRVYFWVVEFQAETKQPHWHLLVDARRIPFGDIVELWSANRPASAPKLAEKVTAENYKSLDRPAFGSVRFSTRTMKGRAAANYACKYLIKPPTDGFPDWVLDHEGRVPRYSASRGFLREDDSEDAESESKPDTPSQRKPSGFAPVHGPECFCRECRGEVADSRVKRRSLKTVRDRLEACGGRSMLIRATATDQPDGTVRLSDRSYVRTIPVPFAEIEDQLVSEASNERCVIRPIGYDADMHQLESTYCHDEEGEGW